LTYYTKKTDTKPRGTIFLNDCEFERDKQNKRLNTIHIIHLPTKKNYYVSCGVGVENVEDWIRALHGSGAVDRDFVEYEKDAKEKARKAEEAAKARAQRKMEDDYVKEKMKKRSTLLLTNRNMTDTAIIHCVCNLYVKEAKKANDDESRTVFCVDVTFDDQTWTVFRKYEKVVTLYDAVYKLKFVKGMCPPKKAPSSMSDAEFANLQVEKLQELLNLLSKCRASVMGSSSARQGFLRFLAPVGWDDIKPPKFVMPFAFGF